MAAVVLGKRGRGVEGRSCGSVLTAAVTGSRAAKRVHILEDAGSDLDELSIDVPSTAKTALVPASKAVGNGNNDLVNRDCQSNATPQPTQTDASIGQQQQQPQTLPLTPRHRDRLQTHLPVTPRHRIAIGYRPVTPRTPRTPHTPSSARSVYSDARKIFTRGAVPGQIVGRDNEKTELVEFVSQRVSDRRGGCLYVSGPPGTGKSALVTHVCGQVGESVKYAYVNCMSVKRAVDLFEFVAAEFDVEIGASTESTLQRLFLTATTPCLVVLDEVDSLLALDAEILYKLFQWALHPRSKLVLIGIANALDLTDRFLPRLKSRNLKPLLLPFLPYTAAEIASVLTSRCQSLLPQASADFIPVLQPTAIQLISKKVAAQTGDIRKAFDIAQRVIDLVEKETREKMGHDEHGSPTRSPLSENPNLISPSKGSLLKEKANTSLSSLTLQSAPRGTLAHVLRATSTTFGNGILQRLQTLNLQQKAVLCALVALETRNTSAHVPSPPQTPEKKTTRQSNLSAPTVRHLSHVYANLCKRDNIIHALSSTEFRDVVNGLEACSLLKSVDGKAGALAMPATPSKRGRGFGGVGDDRRVSGCVSVKDLEGVVEGVGAGVLSRILHGDVGL